MMESQQGAQLLVVDDNEVNRDMLALHLEMAGYKPSLAASGKEALDKLRLPLARGLSRRELEYDLVLLDIMMPEISGIDVLREIRSHYTRADLPVIMVTARDASEDVVEALNHGANDYITKPIDFPVLFARLEAALQLQHLTRQKDEFMAIASHDLKNPLAIVRGFVKMIRVISPEGSEMSAESVDMLNRVYRQTTTMQRIISDFLDFQAMQEGHLFLRPEPMDLYEGVHHAVDALSSYAADKQIVLHEPPPGEARVEADPARIDQVLQNYIGNAIKYLAPGGSVWITVKEQDANWRLEVRDDGPGIPNGESERLFVKYARLSNSPTGGEKSSGLGLVICKQIIEQHGGSVGAQNNTPDPGATFWFELPFKQPN